MVFGCSKDSGTPNIYGSWTVLQTDDSGVSYNVELKINSDNSYDWTLLDSVEGHSNSHANFTLDENILLITQDDDCSSVGEYYVVYEANKLAIISIHEECTPRSKALEYIWKKE